MLATPVRVETFAEIEAEFVARAHEAIWCAVATVDPSDRPRVRVLHPIWDKGIGWIATFPDSPKAKHLAHNPHVAVAYLKDPSKPAYADCRAEWANDLTQKTFAHQLFNTTPEPLGYPIPEPPDDPKFGVLKLIPWRVEVFTLGGETKIWRAAVQP